MLPHIHSFIFSSPFVLAHMTHIWCKVCHRRMHQFKSKEVNRLMAKALNRVFSLSRAHLWGPREPGGEPAQLDEGQPEPSDVHRAHREVRLVQKPPGERSALTLRGSRSRYVGATGLQPADSISASAVWPLPCNRTTCWAERRRLRWTSGTRRLCWRWVGLPPRAPSERRREDQRLRCPDSADCLYAENHIV